MQNLYITVTVFLSYVKEKYSANLGNYIWEKGELGWIIFGLNTLFYMEKRERDAQEQFSFSFLSFFFTPNYCIHFYITISQHKTCLFPFLEVFKNYFQG